jgi:hypothetical protein
VRSPLPSAATVAVLTVGPADHADAAQRRYKKDLDLIKPDMDAYNEQKERAMGLGPGALTRRNSEPAGQVCVGGTFPGAR